MVRAEVEVAFMLVKHNIPIDVADEITPLLHDIFTDSEIARMWNMSVCP